MREYKKQKTLVTAITLALTIGMTESVFASEQIYFDDGKAHEVDLSNHSVVATDAKWYADAIYSEQVGTVVTAPGDVNVSYTDRNDPSYIAPAVSAQFQGKMILGNGNTQTVNVSSEGTNARGLHSMAGGKIIVNGKNATINANAIEAGDGSGFASGVFAYATQLNQGAEKTEITLNAKNNSINATSADSNLYQGEYKAVAIAAHDGAIVNVNNNAKINEKAADPYKVTAIDTREDGIVNINQAGNGIVKMKGNIAFGSHPYGVYPTPDENNVINNNSIVDITLNGADSYWHGNATETGSPANPEDVFHETFNLKIKNGAVWSSNADSIVHNLDLSNGGRVNLAGDNNTLNVKTSLQSDGGVVMTDSLNNRLVVTGDSSAVKNLSVSQNGKTADDIHDDASLPQKLTRIAVQGNSDGQTLVSNVTAPEGVIAGAYNGKVNADGTITGHFAPNYSNQAFVRQAALSLITWRQENNDLNKRLGEVRDSTGEDGIWFRMNRGETEHKDVHNQYNYYQLGYDKKIGNDWILGGAFSYTDGQSYHNYGSATDKHTGFAVYGSQLNKDGSYIDLIAKYAHLKNKFDLIGGIGHGSYDNNAVSLSGEYGKRFTNTNGFWLEPQVELTYGYVDSADFNTRNSAHVSQDSMDSLVGRLGLSIGKNIKAGNIYARVSFLDDFQGDISTELSRNNASTTLKDDIGGSWWEYGIGTNLNLGPNSHFYLDLERAQGGDVDTNWQWNAGFRCDF